MAFEEVECRVVVPRTYRDTDAVILLPCLVPSERERAPESLRCMNCNIADSRSGAEALIEQCVRAKTKATTGYRQVRSSTHRL